MAYTVLDNTPSAGYIAWSGVHIVYKGVDYAVADGNTNLKYVWWDYDYPTVFQTSETLPDLTDDDCLVFFNKNGTHLTVPKSTIVDGGLIVSESILADALAANSVTGVKILAGAVSADKIAASAVGAEKIAAGAVVSEKIAAGAVTADKISVSQLSAISGDLGTINAGTVNADVVIAGQYATTSADTLSRMPGLLYVVGDARLGSQIAGFKRNSVAYTSTGQQVAANVPRYETGKFGQAVMVEEGTTNLLTANQSSVETDTTGVTAYGSIIERVTSLAWHGSACLKVIGNGGEGAVYFGTTMSGANTVTPSTQYTLSAYIKVPPELVGRKFRIWLKQPSGNPGAGLYYTISTTDWVRISTTITTLASDTTGTVWIDIEGTLATGLYYYVDGVQLEQKPYATSWTLGGSTRSAETLTIPL